MNTSNDRSKDEAEIRDLIEDWVKAVRMNIILSPAAEHMIR
jgi:hypothetical protein